MISSATTTAPLPLTTQAADLAGPSARNAARAGGVSRSLVELAIQAAAPEVLKLAASVARSSAKRTATRKSTSSGAGYASSAATSTAKKKVSSSTTASKTWSTAAKKTSPELAFLSDPKLTIEDKLMQLMAVLTARYEADMQQHMDRLAGGGAASKTSTTSGTRRSGGTGGGSKKGGVLATVAKFLPVVGMTIDALQSKSVQAALKVISGPVLAAGATAMGFPMLAPVLLKVGPQLVGAVGDLTKAIDAAGPSGAGVTRSALSGSSSSSSTATTSAASSASGGSSSKSSASSGATNLSDSERQLELMQIQRLQDRQKEMFGLVSNLLRGTHDTRAAIIANTRS